MNKTTMVMATNHVMKKAHSCFNNSVDVIESKGIFSTLNICSEISFMCNLKQIYVQYCSLIFNNVPCLYL